MYKPLHERLRARSARRLPHAELLKLIRFQKQRHARLQKRALRSARAVCTRCRFCSGFVQEMAHALLASSTCPRCERCKLLYNSRGPNCAWRSTYDAKPVGRRKGVQKQNAHLGTAKCPVAFCLFLERSRHTGQRARGRGGGGRSSTPRASDTLGANPTSPSRAHKPLRRTISASLAQTTDNVRSKKRRRTRARNEPVRCGDDRAKNRIRPAPSDTRGSPSPPRWRQTPPAWALRTPS